MTSSFFFSLLLIGSLRSALSDKNHMEEYLGQNNNNIESTSYRVI
jgi:hypothetical protein